MRSRRFASHKRRKEPAQLKMTSMMDILTVLLLFLLKSFVVEGEVITPASGVELPESHSQTTPQESLVVAIDQTRVSVGGEIVADLAQDGGGLLIAGLADRLDDARAQMLALEERRGQEIESLERAGRPRHALRSAAPGDVHVQPERVRRSAARRPEDVLT